MNMSAEFCIVCGRLSASTPASLGSGPRCKRGFVSLEDGRVVEVDCDGKWLIGPEEVAS